MARFVYAADGFDHTITLQATNGEELTLEEAQTWAAIRTATAQDEIVRQLNAIASTLGKNSN